MSSVNAASGSPPRSPRAYSDEEDKRILSWAEDVANSDSSDSGLNDEEAVLGIRKASETFIPDSEVKNQQFPKRPPKTLSCAGKPLTTIIHPHCG